ncbi:MAG: hypothetical protein M3O23_00480 [Actinomycetota bacterium]|nr:hypothetical protein [Actinomycetota bacterium]
MTNLENPVNKRPQLTALLDEGWEPFAVSGGTLFTPERLWLRRRRHSG